MIVHVLFELQVYEKLSVRLTIHNVLYNYVVRAFSKVLVCNRLNLHRKTEIRQVFEGDWRHTDLIFLGWDLDHPSVLVYFEQFL